MARLALGPLATLRLAPTSAVRAKLAAVQSHRRPSRSRHLAQVLAARRSLRRSRSGTPDPAAG